MGISGSRRTERPGSSMRTQARGLRIAYRRARHQHSALRSARSRASTTTEEDSMRSTTFRTVAFGILALAAAYALGTRNARAASGETVGGVSISSNFLIEMT